MDHQRDLLFTYAGLRQVVDKYLVQDRSTGDVYETPQFMYIMIALTIFKNYPKETRLSYVRRYYDAISNTKSTSPHQSWRVSELPYVSLRLVFWLMLMTPWTVFLVLIWPLAVMCHRDWYRYQCKADSCINAKIRGGEIHTLALFLSLKSLNQLYDAVHKMASEVDPRQSTSPSGTKRSKTSSF